MSLTVEIEKRLGDFYLQVSLETGGGILALLGASGCGKSVTLQCIAGILKPDRGRIVLDGRTLFDSEKKIDLPPQKRQVGYLFQQYALFPNMTVRQNVESGARRLPKGQRRAEAERWISALRLQGLEGQYPGQLSGGQQQRVALARILASQPRAILLDEPFSALDSFLKWQLEQELSEALQSFSGPVLWVSHDRDEVYRRCKLVSVLDRGKNSPAVPMHRLFESPGTVAAARLSGCKNFVELESKGSRIWVPAWGVELDCGRQVPEGVSVLGVRSHNIGPDFGENRFPCRVESVVENPFSMVVLVRPKSAAPRAAAIRLEMEKDVWAAYAGREWLDVGVAPDALLLLKEDTK